MVTRIAQEDLIWLPDHQKGLLINAVRARERASIHFALLRAGRFFVPLLALSLGTFLVQTILSRGLSLRDDAPVWVEPLFAHAPTFLWIFIAIMSLIAAIGIFVEWLHDRREAIALRGELDSLGVDVDALDSDWVFDKLVLPMVR